MTSIVRRYLEPLPLSAAIVLGVAASIACAILGWTAAVYAGLFLTSVALFTRRRVRRPRRPRPRTATGEIIIRDLAGPDQP